MKCSESQINLLPALFLARQEFPVITKDKAGQSGNRVFKYAPLEVVLAALEPVLYKRGLMVTQGTDGDALITRLEHTSGEWRQTSMPVNQVHANMQAYGIEITYRRRYAIQLLLGVVTEDDTDGAGGAKERGKKEGLGRIKPTDGMLEALPKEQQDYLKEVAADTAEAFQKFGDAAAFDRTEREQLDNDQKIAFWGLLDSKTRAGLKREAERRKRA